MIITSLIFQPFTIVAFSEEDKHIIRPTTFFKTKQTLWSKKISKRVSS